MLDFVGLPYGPGADGQIDVLQKAAMLQDPQVFAALWLRRSSILFDEPVFEPAVPYGDPDYDEAKKTASICEFAFRNIEGGLTNALAQGLECDWWKNTVGDVVWEEKTFNGKQVFVPGVIDVHAAGSYILWRKGGRLVGVQPFASGTGVMQDGKPVVYDVNKYLIHLFRPSPRHHWDGTDLARVVWTPFYKKNKGHPLNLMLMELFSNPSFVGTAPEDATQEVELQDAKGNKVLDPATGEPVKVSPQQAMAAGLENFGGSGGFVVIPPKAKLEMLQAQGDGRIFVNFEDQQDWQILTGILGTGNMTARAKYGSNASAQTGETAVSSPIALDAMATEAALQAQCRTIVEINAPKKNHHLVPRVRLNAPRRSFYEQLFATILANSPFADERLIDGVAERLGMPKPNYEKIAQMAQEKQQADAANAQAQADAQTGANKP